MRASEYTIYKTKAAARFKIAAPDREFQLGCVMLNMSRAVGEKQYDWENKIAVKLGVNDVTNLLFGIVSKTEVSLFHEFRGETKRIGFKPGDRGWFLSVNELSIPISFAELYALKVLFEYALPKMHNW